MMCPGCEMGMMGGMWWMLLWLAFIIGGIVFGVLVLLRWPLTRSSAARHTDDRALAVLRERFARGEIDEVEFNLRRQMLNEP